MNRWFRLYDDTLNDPKALKLSDKTFRVWIGVLCIASKSGGTLPSFDDMAIMLRLKPEKLQPEIEKLIKSELLDHDDNGLRPHNWNTRQYKSDVSTERVKRFRNGKGNVSSNVSETPSETEAEQRQKAQTANAVSIDYVFSGGIIRLSRKHFDNWTEAYPKIDLRAELTARDAWLGSDRATDNDRKSWFISTSKYLANRNQEAKTQIAVRREPERAPGAIREIL